MNATFQTGFVEAGGSNPAADANGNGNITVRSGNRLPGIPADVIKFGLDKLVTAAWHVGIDAQYQSGQYLFGDEANLTPRLPGCFVMNAHTTYDIIPGLEVFANAQNLLDQRYYTCGTFAPPTSVHLAQAPMATNPHSYSLAEPLGIFADIRLRF